MIIDGHCHCGRQDRSPPHDYEFVARLHRQCGITGAGMFPPVMEVYDRHTPDFEDDDYWRARRERANHYLLDLSKQDVTPKVYPFLFVWNDFRIDELEHDFVGIKWHRHADEPAYHYDDPRCEEMMGAIRERGLPVLIEEEFEHTVRFINELAPDIRICVPHIGILNGGYEALKAAGVWAKPNVFTDTSPGGHVDVIRRYLDDYGPERAFFGSDYPFGIPAVALEGIESIRMAEEDRKLVLCENYLRFVDARNP